MTGFGTESRSRSGFKAKFKHAFREREIILRSEGAIRYLKLRPMPQMVMAGAIAAVTLWLAGANGFAYWQETRLEGKQAEIVEARIAYERLRTEFSGYQQKLGDLARQLVVSGDGKPAIAPGLEAAELESITKGIEGAFDRISRDLDVTEADRRRIIQSRDALHEKIAALETDLKAAYAQVASLSADVGKRDALLDRQDRLVSSLTEERDHWSGKANTFEDELTSATQKIDSLESELEFTVAALSEERSRVSDLDDTRDRLSHQVSTLEFGLNQAETRSERLAENVAQLTESLQSLESERVAMAGEREALTSDLQTVEAELSLHQAATDKTRERLSSVVSQLAELTDDDNIGADDDAGALQALETQIGELAGELRSARNNAADMETAIGEVVVGLAQVAGDSPARLDKVADPEEKVNLTRELLETVAGIQEDQHVLIERLTEQADLGISRNEALLRMAGVDVDQLLSESGFEVGMGGPLEVVEETSLGDIAPAAGPTKGVDVASLDTDIGGLSVSQEASELADSIAILQSRLMRMSALNEVMRCVPLISPVDNFQLTSPFGQRKDPITGQLAIHNGIDIGGWAGIRVHATAPGKVTFAGRNAGYGFMVEIDHGCGIRTVYAHLKRIKVKVGETVEHRAVIGILGSTGRSTGPHVHYEIKIGDTRKDPEAFIEAGRHVHKI